jgi:hypothetical protein
MLDANDDISFVPSELDVQRMLDLADDDRMMAENGTWIVCRYPWPLPKQQFGAWRAFTLIVNHPVMIGMFECDSMGSVTKLLGQLENGRRKIQ